MAHIDRLPGAIDRASAQIIEIIGQIGANATILRDPPSPGNKIAPLPTDKIDQIYKYDKTDKTDKITQHLTVTPKRNDNNDMIQFMSAYRHLTAAERAYVDSYVAQLEKAANKSGQHITIALNQQPPQALIDVSGGMLERPLVIAAITERTMQIAMDTEVNVQRIIKEYAAIAFSNIADYMVIDPISQMPVYELDKCTPTEMAAVRKVKYRETPMGGREMDFELYNKQSALDALAKIYGLLEDDNPVKESVRRIQRNAEQARIGKTDNPGEKYAEFIGG